MSPDRLRLRTRAADYAYAVRHEARALLGRRTDPGGDDDRQGPRGLDHRRRAGDRRR
ncbi:hypothetical protein [Georgenia sp. SUBG003]|uniref:hypothetical protein n=1 Tax=Georgenia sp. SUBG003 TaxID=1497974 RepID=UPI003AB59D5C